MHSEEDLADPVEFHRLHLLCSNSSSILVATQGTCRRRRLKGLRCKGTIHTAVRTDNNNNRLRLRRLASNNRLSLAWVRDIALRCDWRPMKKGDGRKCTAFVWACKVDEKNCNTCSARTSWTNVLCTLIGDPDVLSLPVT